MERHAATDPHDDALFYRHMHDRLPVAERGEGIYIYDTEGRQYIDACGGAMVAAIGHGVREVAEAYGRQAARIAFAHSYQFTNRPAQELAGRLAATFPAGLTRVYFVNSGSEATETAVKIARSWHVACGRPQRTKVVSRWQAYHGATLGAMSMSGHVTHHEHYAVDLARFPHIEAPFCRRCPYGKTYPDCDLYCADALERTIEAEGPDTVSAFIAEPVSGAALGAAVPPEGYWRRIREICDRHQVVLIDDEVLAGMGRTGSVWAAQQVGLQPDVIVTAKGITSGYAPLAAVGVREEMHAAIAEAAGHFIHGHTYTMHAPCCATGLAVLDHIDRHGLFARVGPLGQRLRAGLEALQARLPAIWDVRGLGLLQGVEFARDDAGTPYPADFRFFERLGHEAMARGLVIYPGRGTVQGRAGDHVLIAPHFVCTEAEIDEIVARFGQAVEAVSARFADTP